MTRAPRLEPKKPLLVLASAGEIARVPAWWVRRPDATTPALDLAFRQASARSAPRSMCSSVEKKETL